jgi:hypothetical protein
MPWARWATGEVTDIRAALNRLGLGSVNTSDSLNTSIGVLADQVRRGVANSYTKAEVDALFSSRDATIAALTTTVSGKANASHTHDATEIVSGTIARPVSTGGDIYTSANMYSVGAYNSDLSAVSGRRTMWIGPDGRMGHTASSRQFKQDIESFEWSYENLRRVRVVLFRYISAVEMFGHNAALEFGVIAEEIHDLGLTFLVDYDKFGKPYSVHFQMFGFLAIYLAQLQGDILDGLTARIEALEAR